ncbi:RNA polymerase sigma factor [Streptacidiphilus sp. EB129]|uniref:RNA polymerase sigma factor n=1 Tax=Streptacidiphilus sp. EB129 TaxID=3156262 RepID=UPI0035192B09
MGQANAGADDPHTSVTAPDQDSDAWVDGLTRAAGPERDRTLNRLHPLLLRIARRELQRRAAAAGGQQITGPELDDLAHQAAADALLAITRRVGEFRGESRFTTWAYRFVILEVSSKLGRHFWRTPDARMDSEDWERLPDTFGLDPAREAEWRSLVAALHRAVEQELTTHQRRIFSALVLDGVPLDALVVTLETNRNAVYKALFDARRKLRANLVANGYLTREVRR